MIDSVDVSNRLLSSRTHYLSLVRENQKTTQVYTRLKLSEKRVVVYTLLEVGGFVSTKEVYNHMKTKFKRPLTFL